MTGVSFLGQAPRSSPVPCVLTAPLFSRRGSGGLSLPSSRAEAGVQRARRGGQCFKAREVVEGMVGALQAGRGIGECGKEGGVACGAQSERAGPSRRSVVTLATAWAH